MNLHSKICLYTSVCDSSLKYLERQIFRNGGSTTDREAANTREVHVMPLLHILLGGGWSVQISFSSWWVVSITLHHLCINPIQLQGLVLPAPFPPHAWAWLRHTCHCFRVRCAGCQVLD
ncbi:hypothetical protein VPH35_111999 [Triticum aestivum]